MKKVKKIVALKCKRKRVGETKPLRKWIKCNCIICVEAKKIQQTKSKFKKSRKGIAIFNIIFIIVVSVLLWFAFLTAVLWLNITADFFSEQIPVIGLLLTMSAYLTNLLVSKLKEKARWIHVLNWKNSNSKAVDISEFINRLTETCYSVYNIKIHGAEISNVNNEIIMQIKFS